MADALKTWLRVISALSKPQFEESQGDRIALLPHCFRLSCQKRFDLTNSIAQVPFKRLLKF